MADSYALIVELSNVFYVMADGFKVFFSSRPLQIPGKDVIAFFQALLGQLISRESVKINVRAFNLFSTAEPGRKP